MRPARLYKLASVVLGVAFALLLAEGAIRVAWWAKARLTLAKMARSTTSERIDTKAGELSGGVRDSVFPEIVYELRPNLRGTYDGKRYATDRFGFRSDRTVEVEKPAGVKRIFGVGDSWMWGSGVDNGETYLDALDAHLRASGFKAEVINSGVWGYDATQQVATLNRKGLQFSPDIVVIGLCSNDLEYPSFMASEAYLAASGSALWRVVSRGLVRSGVRTESFAAAAQPRMPFSEFMDAYRELHSLSVKHGFRVVVFSECLRDPPTETPCALGTKEEWKGFVLTALNTWKFRLCGWDANTIQQNGAPWGHASVAGNQQLAARLASCVEELLAERVPLAAGQIRLNRNGDDARLMCDGSLETRWISGAMQGGDEEIVVDLGTPVAVRRIALALGMFAYDHGREIAVELGVDDGHFSQVLRVAGEAVLKDDPPGRTQMLEIPDAPPARLIRIRQVGQSKDNFWSIAELQIWKHP